MWYVPFVLLPHGFPPPPSFLALREHLGPVEATTPIPFLQFFMDSFYWSPDSLLLRLEVCFLSDLPAAFHVLFIQLILFCA